MRSPATIDFAAQTHERLRAEVAAVSAATVHAIIGQVPAYAGPLSGKMGRTIRRAVETALNDLLDLCRGEGSAAQLGLGATRPGDGSAPMADSTAASYELGRGEARNGRSMDALLAAYRIGARTSWQGLCEVAVQAREPADAIGRFAELVFAFIDSLSAASAAGHTDELAAGGRLRARLREDLARALLLGAGQEELASAAERCDWRPPARLTAVLLPFGQISAVLGQLDPRVLHLDSALPEAPGGSPGRGRPVPATGVLLVPDASGPGRTRLARLLTGRSAVLGPDRPWQHVQESYERALRTRRLAASLRALPESATDVLDSEDLLPELVLHADEAALADLRTAALAPLADLSPATRHRLAETLRCWLLHQGRREKVAEELYVHPQTVRYRMTQLRHLYGDALENPRTALSLMLALATGVETR
ncbi:PucR family transcriptional regulator [Streptomyces polyrhachis]|uniref:PucR family transcriptional regulator n=1 Tax=Streptomyces polyrhachis TaxID=1282885 RepID=A0ABW2GIT9_9ACTN